MTLEVNHEAQLRAGLFASGDTTPPQCSLKGGIHEILLALLAMPGVVGCSPPDALSKPG